MRMIVILWVIFFVIIGCDDGGYESPSGGEYDSPMEESPDGRIFPGIEAANITLGEPLDRVKARHGEPNSVDDISASWDPKGITVFLDENGRITMIFIMHPNRAKTLGPPGVGIGSTKQRVEREFGVAEETKNGGLMHRYPTKGISFSYDSTGAAAKVWSISIVKN